ncbi:MAG: hypothetical protein K0R92_2050 [Lachnospiraceae bacterium]|jgi:dihydropyrimidinase|nr:hypothetical protein [Lachnospiraceae bacterium]
MDLILKGGMIVTSKESFVADIRVLGEKISEIGRNLDETGAFIIDISGNYVFPGFIDSHTHFDLDTGTTKTADDFITGTKAAIAGGTTTILDFATQNKGETLSEALNQWHKKARGVSSCDYGFHMAITDWNNAVSEEMDKMKEEGITSYKLYMAYESLRVTDGEIYQVLKRMNEIGGLIGIHCENGDMVKERTRELKAGGKLTPAAHPLSRPPIVEAEAVNRYISLAYLTKTPVNIVHLSTKEGYYEARKGRARGQKIYIETCPQYLLLDDSCYEKADFEGAKYVFSPPARKQEDIDCLWKALSEDNIDTIGTDHCSFNFKGQKELGRQDFSMIPNGIPGVEHRAALLYTYGVLKNRITVEQMCKLLSENTSKLFGLYPRKGCLQVGSDADIVVWNPNYEGTILAAHQMQNVDYTPYEGMPVKGRAERVFLRGNEVVYQGRVIKEKTGMYLPRTESLYI